jgi:hypothetical protein
MLIILVMLFSNCKNNQSTNSASSIQENIPKTPSKVEVTKSNGIYSLYVNNKPFYIKGAGLEFRFISALAKHNANSFRTWTTNNGHQTGKEVLDEAYKNGLMVTMGISVGSERHGFDYNNQKKVNEQLSRITQEVKELKDHPALLIWGIGNELNLRYTNPKVWDAVNEISQMIHRVDGNHPTTTSLAGITQTEIDYIKERCSDVDILSIQMYSGLPNLQVLIEDFGWKGPYMVTEWGATGHWEVPKTNWGAPIEENSTVKASNYLKRYESGIKINREQCIGSYVFLWGQKQERTPTWYGVFLADGQETESVDVMHYIWNGEWPTNRTPVIESFTIDGKTSYDNIELSEGNNHYAKIDLYDPDKDDIALTWELLPESTDLKEGGDREEKPKKVENLFVSQKDNTLVFKSPQKGAYRLFVYANDGNNHAATANIPFIVKN